MSQIEERKAQVIQKIQTLIAFLKKSRPVGKDNLIRLDIDEYKLFKIDILNELLKSGSIEIHPEISISFDPKTPPISGEETRIMLAKKIINEINSYYMEDA